ncbi:MAG: glycosyltransferase family 1 protein, partial [Chloroflexi bacterium]|nr:glycosyltransferase family 1 protein [Chloroflexota bacterium]
EDPLRRTELGAGARELARFFRWERIAAAHLALYRELAEEVGD